MKLTRVNKIVAESSLGSLCVSDEGKTVSFKVISPNLFESAIGALTTGYAAAWAVDAIKHYKSSQKYTATFFAKDPSEKTFYDRIVSDLMKTGNYKKEKEMYVYGGYMWKLRRIK